MLFIKFANALMCLLSALIPITIFITIKKKRGFKYQNEMVENQYPSLFHYNGVENNSKTMLH